MKSNLAKAISAVCSLSIDLIEKNVAVTKDIKNGDLAFPCFLLAKEWGMSPPECAKKLAATMTIPEGFAKVEAVGPYANFFMDRARETSRIVAEIAEQAERYGRSDASGTVVIDYSGPNISKPFHIGHLRATIIGFALYNIFKQLGYTVVGINHLGDWGTQFGFVYAGCQIFGKPEENMGALVERYVEANMLRKSQEAGNDLDKPNVNEMARDYFKRLEAGEPEALEFWKWNLQVSEVYYRKTYSRMGIEFDSWAGESFYFQFFEEFKETLHASGILENSRGALGVDLGEPLGFARLLTDDGRTLYLTRDVITADYREKTYHPKALLYVVGAPQTLHFKQLKGILGRLNHPAAEKLTHIPFGSVPGISTRKMKTDSADISLDGLLDDAHERALERYTSEVSKRSEGVDVDTVAEAVGLGAIYFNYLSRTNIKDFHFNWEEALNFKGDTGPYLLYAVARLHSLEEKAKAEGIEATSAQCGQLLPEAEAWELATLLSRFPAVLKRVELDFEPCNLCNYALDVAKAISRAYLTLRIVGESDPKVASARLALFLAARGVMTNALKLLGMRPVERM